MNIKNIFFTFIFILFSGYSFAQDKIYRTDGTITEAKIKSVGENTIIYVRFDNPSGPEYTILKSDVNKIKYENGSTETFYNDTPYPERRELRRNDKDLKPANNRYKPNILAIAPIQFTENGIAGASLSYERILDKQGFAAFYLPVILEFNTSNTTANNNSDPMFYVTPGIKIYPTGSFGLAKYAIGPSLVIADGQKTVTTYDPNYNAIYNQESHFLMGIMINQSININPTPHFYLGSEIGFGYTYVDNVGGVKQYASFLFQFGIKFGLRY